MAPDRALTLALNVEVSSRVSITHTLPAGEKPVCEETVSPSYDASSGCRFAVRSRIENALRPSYMTCKSNFSRRLPVQTTAAIDDALLSPAHDRRPEIRTRRQSQPQPSEE
jgi:hypothetical protein